MPYHVGEKGSYGCSGYPVIKDGTSEVMGCHDTAASAQSQITAINMSEAEQGKKRLSSGAGEFTPAAPGPSVLDGKTYEEKETVTNAGVGIRNPQAWPGTEMDEDERYRKKNSAIKKPKVKRRRSVGGAGGNPSGATATTSGGTSMGTKAEEEYVEINEGNFVIGMTVDGEAFGRVEHIMWEGGTLGQPGEEYSLESMPPENPAMSVRLFEVEDNEMEPTPYSIGMMYQDAEVVDISMMTMGQEEDLQEMSKAETYSPNDGMKSAARRALKWKEEGKAKGAGTAVGWGRATDIAAGRSMSLSVVKRMYSFFSRHEKASKGATGFRSGEEGYPSNGRIMWDAWGGDAGFSWSRRIAEREKDKSLFGDIFKGPIKNLPSKGYADWFVKAEEPKVGDMVSWNSSGGRAKGKITRILRSGSYSPPGTDVTINGSEDDPAAVIRLYNGDEPTDQMVGHKLKTLRRL